MVRESGVTDDAPAFPERRAQVRRGHTRRVKARRLGDANTVSEEYLRILLSDMTKRIERLEQGRRVGWIVLGGVGALGWVLAFLGVDKVVGLLLGSP